MKRCIIGKHMDYLYEQRSLCRITMKYLMAGKSGTRRNKAGVALLD